MTTRQMPTAMSHGAAAPASVAAVWCDSPPVILKFVDTSDGGGTLTSPESGTLYKRHRTFMFAAGQKPVDSKTTPH